MNVVDRFATRIAGFNVILAAIGALIIAGWSVAMFRNLISVSPELGVLGAAFVIMIGWLIHYVALNAGNHLVSWGASAFLTIVVLIGVLNFNPALQTELAAVAGVSVLAYNESLRLSFAQRRDAIVDPRIYFSSGISIAAVGLFSVVGVQAAKLGVGIQPTEVDGETLSDGNIWVPISVVVLILAVALALIVPTLGRRRQFTKRIRPGERIDLSTIDLSTTPDSTS